MPEDGSVNQMPDQAGGQPPAPAPDAAAPANAAEAIASDALRAAQQAVTGLSEQADADARPFVPENLARKPVEGAPAGLDLLSDVNLHVKIELGRTRMFVEDVLRLAEGAVVELDKLAGDPVDVYVNDRHVARGEVLILNDNFCVRVSEVLAAPAEPR